jgi:hypothetical protein
LPRSPAPLLPGRSRRRLLGWLIPFPPQEERGAFEEIGGGEAVPLLERKRRPPDQPLNFGIGHGAAPRRQRAARQFAPRRARR